MRLWRASLFAATTAGIFGCSLVVSTDGLSSGGASDGATDAGVSGEGGPALESGASDGESRTDATADAAPGDGGTGCPESVDPSLIVHYSFDEGSGTSIKDCSNNHLDAVVHGTPGWTATPRVGSHALSFDGTSTCAALPSSPSLDLAGKAFTIATWIFIRTYSVNTSGKFIFAKTTSSGTIGFRMATDEGNTVNFAVGQASGTNTGINAEVQANVWSHVAISVDPNTATVREYLNGVLVKTRTALPAMIEDPSITAHLGCRADGSNLLDSVLDDFRLYDHALANEEISALAK